MVAMSLHPSNSVVMTTKLVQFWGPNEAESGPRLKGFAQCHHLKINVYIISQRTTSNAYWMLQCIRECLHPELSEWWMQNFTVDNGNGHGEWWALRQAPFLGRGRERALTFGAAWRWAFTFRLSWNCALIHIRFHCFRVIRDALPSLAWKKEAFLSILWDIEWLMTLSKCLDEN